MSLNWSFDHPAGLWTITLTDSQLRTVLKSLAICEADMNDARDNSRSEATREYYTRAARIYKTVWDVLYKQTHPDEFFSGLDKSLLVSEAALDKV